MSNKTIVSLFGLLLINSILNVNAVFANSNTTHKEENTNKITSDPRAFLITWITTDFK